MDYDSYLELAMLLHDNLSRLKNALDDPAYNIILHSCPILDSKLSDFHWQHLTSDFHWHIEIMPYLSSIAGFERGSGVYINPVSPEDAAKWFRE